MYGLKLAVLEPRQVQSGSTDQDIAWKIQAVTQAIVRSNCCTIQRLATLKVKCT
mgnify:CR=1 FL=1